ncbi:MAG: response regulator, partial [Cyclobacteriaceae bacterium]
LLNIQNVRLKVNSKVGEGSVFYFEQIFEYKNEHSPEMLPEVFSSGDSLEGVRILLVEDNDVNVLVARRFLTKWGVELSYAKNGEEGFIKATEESYDLILMDLQMPVMDGYEAARGIRSLGVKTPIIALTASALIDKNDKIYASGIDDAVTKPFDPKELFEKISKYAGKES